MDDLVVELNLNEEQKVKVERIVKKHLRTLAKARSKGQGKDKAPGEETCNRHTEVSWPIVSQSPSVSGVIRTGLGTAKRGANPSISRCSSSSATAS